MDITKVKRYRYYDGAGKGICACGKSTCYRVVDITSDVTLAMCKACQDNQETFEFPFPICVEYRKNLKNSLGMSGFFTKKPSKDFFMGLSGNPIKKTQIDFNSHTLYCTIERAQQEGLIDK